MKILKQRFGKVLENGNRIFIQDKILNKMKGFNICSKFKTEIKENKIILSKSENQEGNVISKKVIKGEEVPVLDKRGKLIESALKNCSKVKITFYKDENNEYRILIEGIKETATVLKEKISSEEDKKEEQLRSLTFCAGGGITSDCLKRAGFNEVAAIEWMPKSSQGPEDKFAKIYEKNHPNAVMFNVPMQYLKASDLPYAEVWNATLDCTDFSACGSHKKEFHTMHLFVHLMRLFYEKPIDERPLAIIVENTPNFEKVPGNILKLCFEENGFSVTMGKLNSLDYGSRTRRERFFLVATAFNGFTFPEPTERLNTPIIQDGVITIENTEWRTAKDSNTLKYFIERNNSITHNHKIKAYDITKDSYIGTITKSQTGTCENLLKHPYKEDTYSFIANEEHLRYFQGIRKDYYLGDSLSTIIHCIGQSVCVKTFDAIVKKLYSFLMKKITETKTSTIEIKKEFETAEFFLDGIQYCFDI